MSSATSRSREELDGIRPALVAVRSPLVWALLLAVGLTAWLYGPLLFPESPTALAAESEQFFFEANEAAGAPVLVLALWLFYRRSHYLDVLATGGRRTPALVVLATTVLLFGWGIYTSAPDLQLASLLGLLAGAVLLLGGRSGLRAFWLPILFLAFALPLSPVLLGAVMYPVQLATAQYAGFILNAIGVESFVQGDQILRPENTFVVIETCSGIRTVVTLTMLTVLLIDLFERRGWHAALLILLAPVVAFLTNGLRVVTLVLNPHSDVASIHNLQGIGMLLIGLTGMYLLDLGIARAMGSDDRPAVDPIPMPVPGDGDRRPGPIALRLLAVSGIVIAMIGLGRGIEPWSFGRGVDEMPKDVLLRAFGDWPSYELAKDHQFRGSVRYLSWARRSVAVEGAPVDVFLGVAEEQLRRHSILTPRLAWPGSGYEAIQDGPRVLQAGREADGTNAVAARRTILRRGAKRALSYSWYERAGSLPAEWLRHALALDRSPFVRPRHMLALRLSTPVGRGGEQLEEAEARIRLVYERLEPELEGFAPTFPEGPERQTSFTDAEVGDFGALSHDRD